MRALAAPLAAAALALAGCGGGGPASSRAHTGTPAPASGGGATPGGGGATPGGGGRPPAARSGPVSLEEVAIIRGWADALRRGDVDAATRYWATPASAANAGPPVQLVTRAAVRFFNESLPCGARLISARRVSRGLVLAIFTLTERPGPGSCGSGVGQRAATVFRIRGGKIDEWVRAAVPTDPGSDPIGSTI